MQDAYPDLKDKKEFIKKAVFAEEEQFLKTLEKGLSLLEEEIGKLGKKKTLSGEAAFKLYDTFGFPLDLTRVICEEQGITVDEEAFKKSMEKQRSDSRKSWKGSGEEAISDEYLKLSNELATEKKQIKFTGYNSLQETSKCLALFALEGALKRVQSSKYEKSFCGF